MRPTAAPPRRQGGAGETAAAHWVRIATLVAPRVVPDASLKRTKARLTAGSKATPALPTTKIPKVGVALAAITVVTLDPTEEVHAPDTGSVWQSRMVTGGLAVPVSADTVMLAPAPRFTVATANMPVPVGPGMLTIPSLPRVAASA